MNELADVRPAAEASGEPAAVQVPETLQAPDAPPRCLNCGEVAGPRYCGHCGQAVDDHRWPLTALFRELFEETLSLDSRLLRTVAGLARPGVLTRAFVEGRRASYLRPLRLYLLASLLLFSSLLALPAVDADDINFYVGGKLIGQEHVQGRFTLRILDGREESASWVERLYADRFARLQQLPPQELLDKLLAQMRSVLPLAFIVFVPILALALKLLYVRRRVLYVDHLVFGAHFQSALFVALALMWVVSRITGLHLLWSILGYAICGLLMLTVYLALALKHVYGQGWGKTALKTSLLVAGYAQLLQLVMGVAVLFVLSRL